MNLDPFEKHTDAEIWRTLELSHLKTIVKGFPQMLQHPVAEGGQNFRYYKISSMCLDFLLPITCGSTIFMVSFLASVRSNSFALQEHY